MVARHYFLHLNCDSSGQSMVEFVLLMPLLLGLAILMIHVNTAIQISIVDQNYSRAQALFLTYNSPFYPEKSKQQTLMTFQMNQILVGVSGNLDSSGDSSYSPEATVQNVARSPSNPRALQASNEAQSEPKASRANVRIRNTVTLCTQNYQVGFNNPRGPFPVTPLMGYSAMSSIASGSSLASYCGSKLKYLVDGP